MSCDHELEGLYVKKLYEIKNESTGVTGTCIDYFPVPYSLCRKCHEIINVEDTL